MEKDTLFNKKKEPLPAFAFNAAVASVFDDMIHRSVPLYRECVHGQAQLAQNFYQPGTRIYDLGCSHGNFGMRLHEIMAEQPFLMVAVDTSRPMLARYAQRLEQKKLAGTVDLVCEDVAQVSISNASVVVLNLTLQFIVKAQRQALIQRIYDGMETGGVLLLTEKVIHETPRINDLQQHYYQQFKRENGYSELEISQKRDALENVLVPETLIAHEARLHAAGFQQMDIWLKWFNFAAMLAVK